MWIEIVVIILFIIVIVFIVIYFKLTPQYIINGYNDLNTFTNNVRSNYNGRSSSIHASRRNQSHNNNNNNLHPTYATDELNENDIYNMEDLEDSEDIKDIEYLEDIEDLEDPEDIADIADIEDMADPEDMEDLADPEDIEGLEGVKKDDGVDGMLGDYSICKILSGTVDINFKDPRLQPLANADNNSTFLNLNNSNTIIRKKIKLPPSANGQPTPDLQLNHAVPNLSNSTSMAKFNGIRALNILNSKRNDLPGDQPSNQTGNPPGKQLNNLPRKPPGKPPRNQLDNPGNSGNPPGKPPRNQPRNLPSNPSGEQLNNCLGEQRHNCLGEQLNNCWGEQLNNCLGEQLNNCLGNQHNFQNVNLSKDSPHGDAGSSNSSAKSFKGRGKKMERCPPDSRGLVGEPLTCKIFEEYLGYEVKKSYKPDFMKSWITKHNLELDMYDPKTKIAIEYNGEQHYIFPNRFASSIEEFNYQLFKDELKSELCEQNGINLIIVPYTIDTGFSNREEKLRQYLIPMLDSIIAKISVPDV